MSLHVSVDFGTSSTCTVVSVGGGEPQVVVVDGQPLVPSAVFAAADGTLFVGHEAERQAAVDPSRFEPHPKRRIDEGELLLGSSVLRVGDVVRAVLQRAVGEARRFAAGAGVDLLVLTHPADWGSVRAGVLRQAAAGLAKEVVLVPEPVAAAVFHSAGHGLPDGGALAVLDLGGGTVDASVVCKQGRAFRVLATKGEPNFGGADIDQALLEHIGSVVSGMDPAAWHKLVEGRDMADRRRRRVLRQDVRGAKETLSRHTYTDVPMPPPFSDAHVTRADLERLVAAPLAKSADLVSATLQEGQVPRDRLAGVFLVGGSSRIPLVARLIHERTGVLPTTLDQPETVVARGALRAVRLDPERTGGLAPAGAHRGARAPAARPQHAGVPRQQWAQQPAVAPPGDSLSRASTIVIGAGDQTRPVFHTPVPRRTGVRPWVWGAGAAAAVVVAVVVAVLLSQVAGGRAAAPPRHVAQYEYGFDYPAGWRQTGGDPQLWQTVVAPRSDGDDLIVVQQGDLGYDVAAGRARAVADLRAEYDRFNADGGRFSGFDASATFAGRDVVYYREDLPGTTAEWFVVHRGQYQVSVGCRYTPAGKSEVERACEQVVSSLSVTG
ncbi:MULTISPECIES: type VII secretion-associated protein [unclassified Saccharopolyspora]|uniref:type VII secretion-associated protein n=1 Tax=unclassified Saccharopolyspora TaxID=2646250 RepID=UPI001CD6A14B|nr:MULTISPECIES: type VII secretion-associated protein [unclassified Saccharopolyspora]MCA1188542.1 type VII secretion-associated protein [Saccharopolyspora sp. 6T]MCA1193268.1 type VII secretion-associated protein [Saccharopolyspora sp. 6V]MCA1279685.1 type VII secretion-associated protein [Saccharopolyspora sp. 7B]